MVPLTGCHMVRDPRLALTVLPSVRACDEAAGSPAPPAGTLHNLAAIPTWSLSQRKPQANERGMWGTGVPV